MEKLRLRKLRSTLNKRPGLQSSCEEEFIELVGEVESLLSCKDREHEKKCHELKHSHKKLLSKYKDLEKEINVVKQENSVLKHQNMILENSFKNHIIDLKDQIKELGEINNEQVQRNKEELEISVEERNKLQNEKLALERHLIEMQQQLNNLQRTEEKYVDTIKDLTKKLQVKEDEINASRNADKKAKKFPSDSEVEALAKKISERFLEEETKHHDGLKDKIMQKIKDIEQKMNIM